jgi:hypothetical protein
MIRSAGRRALATGVPTTLCDRLGDLTFISRLPELTSKAGG